MEPRKNGGGGNVNKKLTYRDTDGMVTSSLSGQDSTAKTCASYRPGLCDAISTIRAIPFLLVWNDEHDGKIIEAVRLAHFIACGREGNEYVELKRTYGSGK